MASVPLITTQQRALKLRTELKKIQFSAAVRPRQGRDQIAHGQQHVTVWCIKDGGSSGGGGTTCSWTFTIKDLRTDEELATLQPKLKGWNPNVQYETPNALGVYGEAFRDVDGTWKLWDVACNWQSEECTVV